MSNANNASKLSDGQENIRFTSTVFMTGNLTISDHSDHKGFHFTIDSGATDHIIKDVNLSEEFVEVYPAIKIGTAKDDVYITATKRGLVRVETELGHHCI